MKFIAALIIFSYLSIFSPNYTIAFSYSASDSSQPKLSSLEKNIKSYLGKNISKVGLCYQDLNSDNKIVINGDKKFIAASTVKVQINMILCDMFVKGAISPKEKLTYTKDCYEGGTGTLQYSKKLNSPIPIGTLSDYSIVYSDNIATRMILKRLGGRNRVRSLIDKKLGHSTDHSRNYITPKEEAVLLKLLYENPDHNPYYNKLINTMKRTVFHDRLDKYIPKEISAHKIGNYKGYTNDVGIIEAEKPYIICIYTENLANANEIIAHISKMVYDYQKNSKS